MMHACEVLISQIICYNLNLMNCLASSKRYHAKSPGNS
jgi:hypothetical protein